MPNPKKTNKSERRKRHREEKEAGVEVVKGPTNNVLYFVVFHRIQNKFLAQSRILEKQMKPLLSGVIRRWQLKRPWTSFLPFCDLKSNQRFV